MDEIFKNMDDLFKTFGEIFGTNPKNESREILIEKVYGDWVIFKHLTPSDTLFTAYDDLIDAQLDILKFEHNYIPTWLTEYVNHSGLLYNPMIMKLNEKLDLIAECDPKNLVNFEGKYEFFNN